MTEIPDPIELMEARAERRANEWYSAQQSAPPGFYRCPYCKQLFDYEPIQLNETPDSPIMCFDCLPEDMKKGMR